jgi:hypothetical protein
VKPLKLNNNAIESLTCLSYGATGSGKTEFLATWPNPVVFCAASEQGHITIQFMEKDKWYDPKWNLLDHLYPVSSIADFNSIVAVAKDEVKKGAKTIGIDSITFLVNMLVNNVSAKGYDLWGEVLAKTTKLREDLHALGVHVVWTAALDADSKTPAIQGQTAVQLPHCCALVLYHTAEEDPVKKGTSYRAWTAPRGGFPARHRFGKKLHSPLGRLEPAPDGDGRILKPEVSYRVLEEALKAA